MTDLEATPLVARGANHDAVRALDPFDFQVAHKRLAWCFRLSVMVNVVLVAALIAVCSAMIALAPLKEVRVALVQTDSRENLVYRVEPITPSTTGHRLVMETIAKGFVENALTIEPIGHGARGLELKRFASGEYFERFKAQFIKSGFVQNALDSGLNRAIIVESLNHIENPMKDGNFLLSVDYVQIDSRDGLEIERKRLRAFLKLTTRVRQVRASEMYENPLGVIVLDMTIQEIRG